MDGHRDTFNIVFQVPTAAAVLAAAAHPYQIFLLVLLSSLQIKQLSTYIFENSSRFIVVSAAAAHFGEIVKL